MSRTKQFAQFLRAAVAVKQKTVDLVEKYPSVLWWSGLPTGLKEVRSPLTAEDWSDDNVRWLTVARVSESDCPAPPESCRPWLDGVELDVPSSPPSLRDHCLRPDENGRDVPVPPTAEVAEGWRRYLAGMWRPWAEKTAVARTVKPIYQQLFGLHQEIKGRDDAYDLFIGVGLYESRVNQARLVRRHLLAFPAEVALDDRTGTLTVAPSNDFLQARVEVDFFPVETRSKIQPVVEAVGLQLADIGPSIWKREELGKCLEKFVHSFATTQYSPDLSSGPAPPGGSRVSFAPALILRPRTLRSLDELLAKIADGPDVEAGHLPLPWRKMMEQDGGGSGSADGRRPSVPVNPQRVYFPLPSNEEQAKIVRSAEGSPGVVVQGPPGTGKSHTIANLISHYLAQGQRVLVTAQTAQALHVLRDKLPMELQQLCVSMLGESRRNDKELERSVQTILSRRLSSDPHDQDRLIAEYERELDASETSAIAHERTLREARAAETDVVEPVPGYRGTRAAIARRVRDERARLSFLKDTIPHDAECPTFPGGWPALAAYHGALTQPFRDRLSKAVLQPPFSLSDALHTVDELLAAKATLEHLPETSARSLPKGVDEGELTALRRWVEGLASADAQVGAADGVWVADIRRQLANGGLVEWRTLLEETDRLQVALQDGVIRDAVDVTVSERSEWEARDDLSRLDDHFLGGGQARSFLVFKPAVVKDTEWVMTRVHVNGKRVVQPADVHRARLALDAWALIRKAESVWPGVPEPKGSSQQRVSAQRHRTELLRSLVVLGDSAAGCSAEIREWLAEQLKAGTSSAEMLRVLRREGARRSLARAQASLDTLSSTFRVALGRQDVAPALGHILAALDSADRAGLSNGFVALAEEARLREEHKNYSQFIDRVRRHAPDLAGRINDEAGELDFAPVFEEFESAWLHRRAAAWLDLIVSTERVEAVGRAARAERRRGQDLLGRLAAAKAWRHALERIHEPKRTALVAWQQAVRNIPATGTSVFRKRAAARRYLDQCLDAIPAWVAPLGRLYETIEASPGLFDVAIIDEASQCWLDSLILFYLAKQIIVVGDDKQISPTVVGVGDGVIAALVAAHLEEFNYGQSFTIGSSLFDHAQRYLSEGVPLREHFRSVPEIIRFSNELCYSHNPLIPLRQVGRDRLEPLKLTYVRDGLRQGNVNDREAQAVVEAVVACHADPAYEEAEFGVICLQGDSQAERIQHLLLERLGPAVFEERKLRCGNPYAFQGDERDVMFLSMVAAPNMNNTSLTGSMYEQRFNVAMSRARDQAWLFHSIQENELGPNCLRRRVLEFFRQPPDRSIQGSVLDIPALQLAAKRAERMTEGPPVPFESWFEVDVALALVAKGYRLSAQVKVGSKSIDLVVEGENGRLAVECDGDYWHGPEQYAQDMFRQQQLERAEWRFVRVRECLFYADEKQAIREVVEACEELGIEAGWERKPSESEAAVSLASEDAETHDFDQGPPETGSESVGSVQAGPTTGADDGSDEESRELPQALFDDTRSGPFTGYSAKDYPDPRHAPPATIRDAVLEIVRDDGPLPKASIYRLYRDGCPKVERASKTLRQQVNKAVYYLERTGAFAVRDEGARKEPSEIVVKLKDQDWVSIRAGGARTLEDVPLSELAAAILREWNGTRPENDLERARRYRELASLYGVQRFTERARERLRPAEEFAFRARDEAAGPLFQQGIVGSASGAESEPPTLPPAPGANALKQDGEA